MADLPCAVISLALVQSTSGETRPCGGESLWWAEAMLWCKGLLMAWGVLCFMAQLLLTGTCDPLGWFLGAPHPTLTAGLDGPLQVHTALSVMRARVGSGPMRVTQMSHWAIKDDRKEQTPTTALAKLQAGGVLRLRGRSPARGGSC